MAKKQKIEQGEEMAKSEQSESAHVFPLWLYKKAESKLFKSKEHFDEHEDKNEWKDSPAHFEE